MVGIKKESVTTRAAKALLHDEPLRDDVADVLFDVAFDGINRASKNKKSAKKSRPRKGSPMPDADVLTKTYNAILKNRPTATERDVKSATVNKVAEQYPDADLGSIRKKLNREMTKEKKRT